VGEVRGWSPEHFSRLPGGSLWPLSPVGIAWLAPLVGAYLGWRLGRAGEPAPHPVVSVGVPVLAALGGALAAALAERILKTTWTATLGLWGAVSVLVAALAFASWPALGRLLLAYAYAARVPVAVVMALAMWRHWGTHYDALPPGFPSAMPLARRWLWTGLLPQATIWVAWTMVTGAVLAPLGHWAAGRGRR
jgi:hypothetical protein